MVKKFKTFGPQLVFAEQTAGSVVVTNEQKLSLYKKSQKSGISTDVLEEVYRRGYRIWNESFGQTAEQFAFDRVNSFIAGGFAADLDDDLIESLDKAFPFKYHGQDEDGIHKYTFTPGKGASKINVSIMHNPKQKEASVTFHSGDEEKETATGEHPRTSAKVFGTVGKIMQDHGNKHSDDVNNFVFSADKSEPSRVSLYRKIAQRHGGEELANTSKYQTGFKVPNPASSNVNEELMTERKRGLWDNIHAKRERIKHGSGEHMRKPGSKGAPTDAAIKASQNEEADPCWKGYNQIGMKMKNGKKVPNCVPVEEKFSDEYMKQGRMFLKLKRAKAKAASQPQKSKEELRQMAADAMKNTAQMQKENIESADVTSKLNKFLKDYEDRKNTPSISVSKAENRIPDKPPTPTVSRAASRIPDKKQETPIKLSMKEEQMLGSKTKVPKGHFKNTETSEPQSHNPNDPDSRFDGTSSGAKVYADATPGQGKLPHHSTMSAVKKVVKETMEINEATYKGRKVSLNKPFRTSGGPKKSAVYVDPDGDGKAKIVRFGDPNLSIKKDQPARKRSYCARSAGQGNLTKKDSANYWSRRAWNCEETINELSVPAGTTGNRTSVPTPSVAVRMASGKIEKHPPGKSGSSGGGDEE